MLIHSLGIANSLQHAGTISNLFKNLSIQLKQRPQYDFGLRAMKFFIFNLSQVRRTITNEEESILEALNKTFYARLEEEDK